MVCYGIFWSGQLKNNSLNLHKKKTNSRILVVIVKWRHRAIVLLLRKKEKKNKQTNTNKTICTIPSVLQPKCFLMSGAKLHKPRVWSFFFFSETFSLVLMQKTCLYFCYAVTMRSFSNIAKGAEINHLQASILSFYWSNSSLDFFPLAISAQTSTFQKRKQEA